MIKPDHIVERQGKQFILYKGLLNEAHERGLKSIITELLQSPSDENMGTAICRATVTLKDESVFTGIGDASPNNVTPFVANAIIRMAETRSKARALRDALNIEMVALEELADDPHAEQKPVPEGQIPPPEFRKEVLAPMPTLSRTDQGGGGSSPEQPHWCAKHNIAYFKTEKMRGWAHKIKDTQGRDLQTDDGKAVWCNEEQNPISPELTRPTDPTPLALKDAQSLMAMAKQVGYNPEQIHTWILGTAKKNGVSEDGETIDIIARFSPALMKKCRGQLQAKMPPEEEEEEI